MLFLVFLLTLERAGGTKLRAGGMGQEEKPTGGERRELTRMKERRKLLHKFMILLIQRCNAMQRVQC